LGIQKEKMMKYVRIYAWLLLVVFFTPCQGQTKTDLPTDTIQSETKGVTNSYGPTTSVRTIQQDKKGNM
jgi:hypothetical protein